MREKFRGSLLAKVQVPLFLNQQVRATRKLTQELSIDIVNAHWLVPQGLTSAMALSKQMRAKLVVHAHAGDVYLLQKLALGKRIAGFVVEHSSLVFADGSHVRDTLDGLLGKPSGAVLQPMGVHCDVFRQSAMSSCEKPIGHDFQDGFLLFVGRFVEKKGVTFLLRAMHQIVKGRANMGLYLVGSGPEEEKLRSETERLGIQSNVRFLGQQPHRKVIEYLHACRLAVVPSIIDSRGETEGMPTVVVEAMAAGVLVVGSQVDGIPDVIRHGENGWLCPEKDENALAATILEALADSDSQSVIEASEQRSRLYDWEEVAKNYIKHIAGRLPQEIN